MRVLLLDIETAPNIAYVWGLFEQNIAHDQVVEASYVLCWAAKWLGEDKMFFASRQRASAKKMLKGVHALLDDADVVIHYYGSKFDIPTLNKEFVIHGFLPPSPYRQIDLKKIVAQVVRFESNKLDYVARVLGIGTKVKHRGFQLWVKCMNGDPTAWAEMEEYNRHDVTLLEPLYRITLPWIPRHPNRSVHDGTACCPKCGSGHFQKRGVSVARSRQYARYQCQNCGGWFRGGKSLTVPKGESMTEVAA